MRRLTFILALLALLITGTVGAYRVIEVPEAVARLSWQLGGGVAAPAASAEFILSCDDNAASTAVTNTGTAGTVAVFNANTSTIHSDTRQEGTGAFALSHPDHRLVSANNYNSNKIYLSFWIYPDTDNHTWETIFKIDPTGNLGSPGDSSVYVYWNDTAGDEISIYGRDSGGTNNSFTTTDLNAAATTWVKIRIAIDASANPWTVSIEKSSDGSAWTTVSKDSDGDIDAAATTFNAPVVISDSGGYKLDGDIIDEIRLSSVSF